jgi:TRAP-type C4-dicarboxylate transport system substrate-binding protein
MLKATSLAVCVTLTLAGAANAKVDELRAVTALPATNVFTKRFLSFVKEVNDKGKDVVHISVIGGPEAIPPTQQDTALRNGVVDMQSGPASYYVGTVPESAALKGASITAAQARANGALAMLDEAWQRRVKGKLLAWIGSGAKFYIFLNTEPKLKSDGSVDFRGMSLRSVPTYRDWFTALGAKNVMIPASDIFTAMQRGVVSGFGSPALITDMGLTSVVKVRIQPPVWQNDVVIMVNKAKWDSLSDQAKKLLQDISISFEKENEAFYGARLELENKNNLKAGIKFYDIPGQAGKDYVNTAHETVWAALRKANPDFAAKIRDKMFPKN